MVLRQSNFGGIPSTVRLQRLDREAREERARCAALLVRTRVLAFFSGITLWVFVSVTSQSRARSPARAHPSAKSPRVLFANACSTVCRPMCGLPCTCLAHSRASRYHLLLVTIALHCTSNLSTLCAILGLQASFAAELQQDAMLRVTQMNLNIQQRPPSKLSLSSTASIATTKMISNYSLHLLRRATETRKDIS